MQQCQKKKFQKISGNTEEDVEHFNETTFEDEEKELVMAFNILTLKYKDKAIRRRTFSTHIGPHSLLIVEVIYNNFIGFTYLYLFYSKQTIRYINYCTGIMIGIKLILTLILIHFYRSDT